MINCGLAEGEKVRGRTEKITQTGYMFQKKFPEKRDEKKGPAPEGESWWGKEVDSGLGLQIEE